MKITIAALALLAGIAAASAQHSTVCPPGQEARAYAGMQGARIVCVPVQQFAENKPPPISGSTSVAPTFTLNPYPDIFITCRTGSVVISTKTGHVEFRDGCDPDDAARSFWRAVEQMGARK